MKKFTQILLIALVASAPSANAAIVLPNSGNTITFEAEAADSVGSGAIITTTNAANASGGNYVDGLGPTAAGGGDAAEFISFNISNVNPALTYLATVFYRKGGGTGAPMITATYELYSVGAGPSYTLETAAQLPWLETNGWTVNFVEEAFDNSFQLDAGTTAIRFESLTNGGNGIAHLDKFTITAIPEPSAALLGGLGLLLLLRRRRA